MWYLWATGQDLDNLVRYSIKSGYYAYSNSGMEYMYFIFAFAIFLINTSTVYYLFRPHFYGIYTAISALVVGAIVNVLTLSLILKDIDGAREAYAIGREIRGLPVREEALNMIFSINGLYTSVAVSLAIYFFVSYIVFRNKNYFYARGA